MAAIPRCRGRRRQLPPTCGAAVEAAPAPAPKKKEAEVDHWQLIQDAIGGSLGRVQRLSCHGLGSPCAQRRLGGMLCVHCVLHTHEELARCPPC